MRARLLIVLFAVALATPALAKSTLDEGAVDGLVTAWLQAQNNGDFDAYASLYAGKFYGVRRTGAVTRKFDHDGWLKDRKRMFRNPMSVQTDGVSVRLSAGSDVVNFSQTWASGTYKDTGDKQLVVVVEKGHPKIAREEMLASRIVATGEAASSGPIDPDLFSFVIDAKGPAAVVQRGKRYACKEKSLILADRGVTAICTPPASELTDDERALVGKHLRVFGRDGNSVPATVSGLRVVVGYEPHFGTIQMWNGEMGDEKRSDLEVARDAWSQANDDDFFLVAELALDLYGVIQAQWAQSADTEPPDSLGTPIEAQGQIRVAALRAFGKLKGYRENQAAFREEVGGARGARWDTYEGAVPKVRLFQPTRAGKQFVAVSATAGAGCGDFYGEFWAIWEIQGSLDRPKLRLLTDPANPGKFFVPTSAVDLDGDGIPEFLNRDVLVRPQKDVHRPTEDVGVNSYDCPC